MSESTTKTPEEWGQMTKEEREEFAEAKKAELDAAIEAESGLSDSEQNALDKLRLGAEKDTEYVELTSGVEVEVRTTMSASVENTVDRINRERDSLDVATLREMLVEVVAYMILEESYGSEAVWRMYAEEYGVMALGREFARVMSPALTRMEDAADVQSFRTE